MMNREDYIEEALNIAKSHKNLFLQWPTGLGKSRCALEIIKEFEMSPYDTGVVFPKYLIVVPKLVLIENWKNEIKKWLGENKLSFFHFTTYVSFYKTVSTYWNCIIFDEGHHFTERCAEAYQKGMSSRVIILSATSRRESLERYRTVLTDLWFHKVSTRRVIEEEILPDPTVFVVPLSLDELKGQYVFVKNPNGKGLFRINYAARNAYFKRRERIEIICTAIQCHLLYCKEIEYLEKRYKTTQQPWLRNLWLHAKGERLKWLSAIKTPLVKDILKELEGCRTLTFCSSIAQTEELGKYNINSKRKKEGDMNLKMFNEGKINHITACSILDEGVNLTSCQVGIFAGLNSSETMVKQRLGRILRHKNPLIILLYFVNTRDEEILEKMKKDYNPELIHIVEVKDLKQQIKTFMENETDH